MKNLKLYESFNQRSMILRHKMSGEITVNLQGSQIIEVVNPIAGATKPKRIINTVINTIVK